MHTNEPRTPLTDMGYETEDLNMRGLGKGTLYFFLFAFASILGGGLLFWLMDSEGIKDSMTKESQQPFAPKVPQDPNPLLQTNVTVKMDTMELRKMEDNALATPAYIDKTKGIIRIPIDRAIDLTVERMQPGQPTTTVNPGSNVVGEGAAPSSLPERVPAAAPSPTAGATGPAGAVPTSPPSFVPGGPPR